MTIVRTAELTGAALDWAVAVCEGYTNLRLNPHIFDRALIMTPPRKEYGSVYLCDLNYSSAWELGGPIIERNEIRIRRNFPCSQGREWEALPSITARGAGGRYGYGPTPLIAAMRGYATSELGDVVDVPEELL